MRLERAAFATLPRDLAISAVFNALLAVAFTVSGAGFLAANFVLCQAIGLSCHLLIDAPRRMLWPNGVVPPAKMALLAAFGIALGWVAGSLIARALVGNPHGFDPLGSRQGLGVLAMTIILGIAATAFFWSRERLAQARTQAVEARLKMLQAQIEPHFLFNTLANLDALIGIDPARARAMLGHLNDYLRATLTSARKERNTLADEFALIAGYLQVIGVRMGPRLAFTLELPDSLRSLEIPPMLLQPLVENAIRHGLEPKIDGGRVDIAVRQEAGKIAITVADTGIGHGNSASPGTGFGLAHVRERLSAAYGAGATCEVATNPGGGTMVALRVPLDRK
jgi:signal transduction histidine kinase